MFEEIRKALTTARINKDGPALTLLQTLVGEIEGALKKPQNTNKAVDDVVLATLVAFKKGLNEMLSLIKEPHRIEQVLAELSIVESFLPKMLTVAEIQQIIDEVKASGISPLKPAVMKHLKANHSGQYDGKIVSQMIDRST